MIKLLVSSEYDNTTQKVYEIKSRQDILEAFPVSHTLSMIVNEAATTLEAAENAADYLSGHHMHIEVQTDEKSDDPEDNPHELDLAVKPEKVSNLQDLAFFLESNEEAEEVDIPENIVLQGATHRWDD